VTEHEPREAPSREFTLDREAVPAFLHSLVPLAERWGVGDDNDREDLVERASLDDLEALISSVDDAPDELWEWLVGPESHRSDITDEYAAITCLTMAADSARLEVRRRRIGSDEQS
jgi:hypothetical protein